MQKRKARWLERSRRRSYKLQLVAKNKQRETDLKLNRKKFRKVIDTHTHGIIYYINDEDGITYEIQQGKVDGVEYYPPKRYDHLYCGDPVEEK